MTVQDKRFLIIGGMPKAGSTSVYNWLTEHPEFAHSTIKETRFFLDQNYPLPSAKRFDGDNLDEYMSFFPKNGQGKVYVESSPDYLYCETPLRIADLLPQAKIIFILRDPVERAVSWYKFAAQLGHFDKGFTFEDYITPQLGQPITNDTLIHKRAIDQNRVNKYLPPFQEAFGDRCLLLNFDDVKANPRAVTKQICVFCGVDDRFFDDYEFAAKNVSTGMQASRSIRLYYRTRAWITYRFKPSPRVRKVLLPLAKGLQRLLSPRQMKIPPISINQTLKSRIYSDAQCIKI